MNARNGKIARLPRHVREELNQRLECSEPGPKLLDWLNALREVKKVLREDFDQVPVSKQNLSEWRRGGFQEWLAREELWAGVRNMNDFTEGMDPDRDNLLADDVATVMAARFAGLLTNWNGEVDEKFEAKTRVLNRLCRSVVQLQRGVHRACRESIERQRLQEEKEKAVNEELKEKLTAPLFDTLKVAPMAEVFGGGTKGWKIAEYITAIQRGKFSAKLDILPTDQFEEPVKARKTKPEETDKPLEENEMEENEEEEASPAESDPVKPGQTDLDDTNKAGVGVGVGVGLRLGTEEP